MLFKHIMIDIETLGVGHNAVICSIGAVLFDMASGNYSPLQFYSKVDIKSCTDAGLVMDADTVEWWLKKGEEARLGLFIDAVSLNVALLNLREFIKKYEGCEIWSNGVCFDIALLRDAYNKVKIAVPWEYYQERDVRTLVSFMPEIKTNSPFEGTAHTAIDDCLHQIKYCSAIYQTLNILNDGTYNESPDSYFQLPVERNGQSEGTAI